MKYFILLGTVVLAGISAAACGGIDTGGLFGSSSNPQPDAGSGTGGAGQGGASSSGSPASSGSATASSSTTTTSSSAGTGGSPVSSVGCSDGTREYYADAAAQPKIAGCSGAWSILGVTTPASMQPACNRVSGNSSANPTGMGCNVEDLCAEGWYVCHGAMDVKAHSATGLCDPFADPNSPQLFITRQVQDMNGNCSAPPDMNNVTGCGVVIGAAPAGGCDPLNRRLRIYDCWPDPVWFCGADMSFGNIEASVVRKDGPERGGVLCCAK